MLPADIVGTLIYHAHDATFHTKHGPVFANLVLADEINRAPAKVQSALLEAMQERQVTLGDENVRAAGSVRGARDAKSHRARGHVSVARGAGRSLFAQSARRLSESRRRARAILDAMSTSAPDLRVQPVVSKEQILASRAKS